MRMSNQKQKKKQLNNAMKFAGSGLQMGLTIYIFNWFGKWLDTNYKLDFAETTLTLLAIFASMYLIIKQVLRISNQDD